MIRFLMVTLVVAFFLPLAAGERVRIVKNGNAVSFSLEQTAFSFKAEHNPLVQAPYLFIAEKEGKAVFTANVYLAPALRDAGVVPYTAIVNLPDGLHYDAFRLVITPKEFKNIKKLELPPFIKLPVLKRVEVFK